ncbi:MAG: PqqD family protein [Cyanobacteria bacterium QS_4_48_99]|nr:MAG: PqqD family protein [Cyanobacteria bacterium QS_4_48_99]
MAKPNKVSNYSIIRPTQDQVSSDLAGEAVILHLNSGVYYGVNEVGARIWNSIQQQKTVNDLQGMLLEEYEVEPEQLRSDTLPLLQQLAAEGLIEVKNEANP